MYIIDETNCSSKFNGTSPIENKIVEFRMPRPKYAGIKWRCGLLCRHLTSFASDRRGVRRPLVHDLRIIHEARAPRRRSLHLPPSNVRRAPPAPRR